MKLTAKRSQHPRAHRFLLVGGACVDRFQTTREVIPGTKHNVQTQLLAVGGGGANVAQGLRHLDPGNEVDLLAPTGEDDDGSHVRGHLKERGVNVSWGLVPGQATSRSVVMIATATGRSTIFSETGARSEAVPLDLVAALLPRCHACWLVAPTRNDQLRPLLHLAARADVPVFFGLGRAQIDDLGYDALAGHMTYPVSLLICNRAEAFRLTRTKDLDEQLSALRFGGRVQTVVISAGAEGLHALHEGERIDVEAYTDPSRPVVDETGAGDAAQAVLGHALLHGWPLAQALHAAARQGFEAVTALGATTNLLSAAALREHVQATLAATSAA